MLRLAAVLLALAASAHPADCAAQSSNTLRAFGGTAHGLSAQQLAVVINENDPASVEVGLYYARARGVPAQNVVRLRLPAGERQLDAEQFAAFRAALEAQLGADIQALLLVWNTPYAVECNSITGALAQDSTQRCAATVASRRSAALISTRRRCGPTPTMR